MAILFSYIATLVPLVGLDLLWLGVVMKGFYQNGLSAYLGPNVNVFAAAPLYLIFAGGIWYFAVAQAESWPHAMFRGALLGFVAYSLYNLSNFAAFKSWPLIVGLVDMGWGTVVSAIVAGVGYGALQFYIK